jgi:hypothetical protein
MKQRTSLEKRVIICEAAGFLTLLLIIWLNEVLDLPHNLLGANPSRINLAEALFESFGVIILASAVIFATHKLLKKITYLEGFMPVCAFCKRIKLTDDKWVTIQEFMEKHSDAVLSHGLCPECLKSDFREMENTTAENYHEIISKH